MAASPFAVRDAYSVRRVRLGAGAKKDAVDTVSKAQARMRKCGFCNGAGHFYPIDEGPLRECQICNGLGLLKVKVLPKRPKGRGRPRDAKVDPGRPSQSSSYLVIWN